MGEERLQAEKNLDEFAGEDLVERLLLALEAMSLPVINNHKEDAYDHLGRERMRRLLDDTEELHYPENDTEIFEYLNAIFDEYDTRD